MSKDVNNDFNDLHPEDKYMNHFVDDVMFFEEILQDCSTNIVILRDAMVAQAVCIMLYKRDIKLLRETSSDGIKSVKSSEGPFKVSNKMLHDAYKHAIINLMDYMNIKRTGKH